VVVGFYPVVVGFCLWSWGLLQRGVPLHRCGVLLHHREILPCCCRVLPHRCGVSRLVVVGDLLGRVEARRGHHSMWFASLGWEFKSLVVHYVGFGKKKVIGVA
jgi:hypothetical protein